MEKFTQYIVLSVLLVFASLSIAKTPACVPTAKGRCEPNQEQAFECQTKHREYCPCRRIVALVDLDWPPYAYRSLGEEVKEEIPELLNDEANENIDDEGFAKIPTVHDKIKSSLKELDVEMEATFNPPVEEKTELKSEIEGVAVDLAKMVFQELDLPLNVIEIIDARSAELGLRLGDIDMVLALYEHPHHERDLTLVRPGYVDDPLMALMRKEEANTPKRWEDLIGPRGIFTQYFKFDESFDKFRQEYLFTQKASDLVASSKALEDNASDYLLGSHYQLDYLQNKILKDNKLRIVPKLSSGASVHMAFSNNSPCRHYLTYIQKRLLELKKDGTIDELLEKHLGKFELSPQAKDKFSYGNTLDDLEDRELLSK